MPKALPINPDLVRALFSYDPTTGNLLTKPTAKLGARRVNSRQWEFGAGIYSMHRIIWAYHNPENANPRYIRFRDDDPSNTRIENLYARNTHPRWEGHVKQVDAEFDEHGRIIFNPKAYVVAENGAMVPKHLIAAMGPEDLKRFGIPIEE